MPPPSAGKKPLTEDEKTLNSAGSPRAGSTSPTGRWCRRSGELPKVKMPGWVKNEIDAYVLASLDGVGLAVGARGSRDAGASDLPRPDRPAAHARRDQGVHRRSRRMHTRNSSIDSSRKSPTASCTAERLTMPWLDKARYADTNGIHMDAGRQMWLRGDWVINAFRDNMPYDRFIVEQLAGDLIPDATVQQKIASGFNRNHRHHRRGRRDPRGVSRRIRRGTHRDHVVRASA